jgi:hypothetical protein
MRMIMMGMVKKKLGYIGIQMNSKLLERGG